MGQFTENMKYIRSTHDGPEIDVIEELAKCLLFLCATNIAGSWRHDSRIRAAWEALDWTYEEAREWAYSDEAREWARERAEREQQ